MFFWAGRGLLGGILLSEKKTWICITVSSYIQIFVWKNMQAYGSSCSVLSLERIQDNVACFSDIIMPLLVFYRLVLQSDLLSMGRREAAGPQSGLRRDRGDARGLRRERTLYLWRKVWYLTEWNSWLYHHGQRSDSWKPANFSTADLFYFSVLYFYKCVYVLMEPADIVASSTSFTVVSKCFLRLTVVVCVFPRF